MSRKMITLATLLLGGVAAYGSAIAHVIDPCLSSAIIVDQNGDPVAGTGTWLACPQGDGPQFSEVVGWGAGPFHIRVEVLDLNYSPFPGIPATDLWLIDCAPPDELILCGGSASSNADSSTNGQGITTISTTTLAAGGCANGLAVVAQGFVLLDPATGCTTVMCFPVNVRSPDIDADGEVNLPDLAIFAGSFPPGPYDTCCDFDGSGVVNLRDLSAFAGHFGPPGHACPN